MADQSPSSVLRQAAAKVRSGKSIVHDALAEPLAVELDACAADFASFTYADDFPIVTVARVILEASGG